ncbi:MAG TPA: hypothetical protein VG056_10270 [Pirellulales bacterium]|jgi:hypothetical protein|nr:hypothetical protein [Pirellulales bacterium]
MLARAQNIKNLDNLRDFVNKTLCFQHQLVIGAFRMTERLLLRGDKPCGMLFCLHGPRAVKFTAVWETERNTVLFYGSTGERLNKIQLVEPLDEGLPKMT